MPYVRSVADEVLDDLPVLVPEDLKYLKQIAWKRGAIIRDELIQGAEARLLVIPGKKSIITLSSSVTNPQRKRFGIVHELGHLELHRGDLGMTFCTNANIDDTHRLHGPNLEQEANQFAAYFLMPARFVGEKYSNQDPSFDLIQEVHNELDVSITAAALRLIDFSPECLALVFSHNNIIKRFKSTQDFDDEDIFINVKGTVGRNTTAGRIFAGLPTRDGWRDVRASDWLREGGYRKDARMKEWSVNMLNYGLVMTLLWVDDDIYPEADWF